MTSAADILVPNEYLKEDYDKRYGVVSTVLHNPCEIPDLETLDRHEKIFDAAQVNIVYTGSVYHAHYDAFKNLIRAIEATKRDDIRLHIYSSQRESLLRSEGVEGPMLVFHPPVSSLQVPSILRQADVLFLPLAFDSPIPEVIRTSAPGKTGEYLAAGRPILVHAPRDSFVTNYFVSNGCGIAVDDQDPAILSEALLRLINDKVLQDDLCTKARSQAVKDFDVVRGRELFAGLMEKYLHGE
jgi:glycosyltransferase involved in cell wall biosynthesis